MEKEPYLDHIRRFANTKCVDKSILYIK